jgi:hypothetical protein
MTPFSEIEPAHSKTSAQIRLVALEILIE